MVAVDSFFAGRLLETGRRAMAAPGGVAAALAKVLYHGNCSRDAVELFRRCFQCGDGRQKAPGVGMCRMEEYLLHGALFHDLPEVLTKDVISPVKTNVSGLAELLNEYETDSVRSEIMPLLPEEWRDEFKFMIFDPFRFKDDPVHGVTDGPTIKLFDVMGAYMEAYVSRRYGISSSSLRIGEDDLRSRLIREGGSVGAADLINRLESMDI
ncbi:hypothetical protein SDC9_168223 [bioreactor metagenome]|uniref:HD domain-containing protein n=1 Tax=bioreactor metagenome TaxID=1076179 RepID=A0A645G9U9_9ZZZZ